MAIFTLIRRQKEVRSNKKKTFLEYSSVSNVSSYNNNTSNSNSHSDTIPNNKQISSNKHNKKEKSFLHEASVPLFDPSMRTSSMCDLEAANDKDEDEREHDQATPTYEQIANAMAADKKQKQDQQQKQHFIVNEDDWDCPSNLSSISTRSYSTKGFNNSHDEDIKQHPSNQNDNEHKHEGGGPHEHNELRAAQTETSTLSLTESTASTTQADEMFTSNMNNSMKSYDDSNVPKDESNTTNETTTTEDEHCGGSGGGGVLVDVVVHNANDTSINKTRHMDRIVRILKSMERKKGGSKWNSNKTKTSNKNATNAAAIAVSTATNNSTTSSINNDIVRSSTSNSQQHLDQVSHVFEDNENDSIDSSSYCSCNILNSHDIVVLETNTSPNSAIPPSLLSHVHRNNVIRIRNGNVNPAPASLAGAKRTGTTTTVPSPTSVTSAIFPVTFDANTTQEIPAPIYAGTVASPEAAAAAAAAAANDNSNDNKSILDVSNNVSSSYQGNGCHSCISSPTAFSQHIQESFCEIQREVQSFYLNSPLATVAPPTVETSSSLSYNNKDDSRGAK
uniref:Uncharacterized protein n=1 Tax=Pseudo-nitzschia australis TaxID=44445 RepID=A0A7S4AV11_9STRA|mmetsp:Transcript_18155/g.39581  ORF Transcript_18155/g.39581 Transcript_18155/m.39581 type:complete len:561 (-) Transcript_18155:460-2142(-)